MGDKWSEAFIKALKDGDTERVKQIPKADLHNHFVLGGSRAFIRERKGLVIPALEGILESMQEMDRWNQEYIGKYFESGEGRRFLIEAAFVQAREDGVTVLEIGEDVWGLGQYFGHDVNGLTEAFLSARDQYAPDLELRLVIGLSRHCPVKWLLEQLEPFWGRSSIQSICMAMRWPSRLKILCLFTGRRKKIILYGRRISESGERRKISGLVWNSFILTRFSMESRL